MIRTIDVSDATIKQQIQSSAYLSRNPGWAKTLDRIVCSYVTAKFLGLIDPTIKLDDYAQSLRSRAKDRSSFHNDVEKLETAIKMGNVGAATSIAPMHETAMQRAIKASPYLSASPGWSVIREHIIFCYYKSLRLGTLDTKTTLDAYARSLRGQKTPDQFNADVLRVRATLDNTKPPSLLSLKTAEAKRIAVERNKAYQMSPAGKMETLMKHQRLEADKAAKKASEAAERGRGQERKSRREVSIKFVKGGLSIRIG